MTTKHLIVGAALASLSGTALAVPFSEIRIGDLDGFGETALAGKQAANGGPVDTNNNGILEPGEFLPDRNTNGSVATGSNDDFDNRSAGEIANTAVSGTGYTDSGTTGSKWTDISLSTSFSGPDFPDPGGPGLPNEPLFEFRFDVTKGDIDSSEDVFFNLVFGDYDVVPAQIEITTNDGSNGPNGTTIIPLTTQANNQGEDGLIQAAFATLSFSDVFSDGGAVWNGYLDVKFEADNEPYTTFDYVELSVDPIDIPVPEPSALALLAVAAFGAGARRAVRG